MDIRLRRVYEPPAPEDGARVLVDRLWPRGLSKDAAKIDLWLKDAAPSNDLRKWFNHRSERWDEFRQRYWVELHENAPSLAPLYDAAKQGLLTLLFAAKDETHNNAVALKEYLERHPRG